MRKILCLTICLLACAIPAFGEELLEPIGVRLDSETVVRGTISNVASYDGAVVAPVEKCFFEVDGKILSINVLLGEAVKAGDVLMTLDESELVEGIEQLDIEIEHIKALMALKQQLAAVRVKQMDLELKRMAAEGADDTALALYAFDIEQTRIEAEQDNEQSQLSLSALLSDREALISKTGRDKIIAPFDGHVVYQKPLNAGDYVDGYDVLIAVADDNKKRVTSKYISAIYMDSAYSTTALIGEAAYELTALPVDIRENLAISLKGGELESHFDFASDADNVEIGQYALVVVELLHKEDVLIIPRNALTGDSTGRFVYKLVNGVRVRCPVKVGAMSTTSAEIIEGLSEGDEVYVKD